jgi:hypothetical protein
LWKLKITLKRAEVILSAFGGNFEGAYKRYRVADFHVKFPSTPFKERAGHAEKSTPSPHVSQLFFSSQGGPGRLVRMSTPSAPFNTPSATDPLDTKAFKSLKRKLDPDDFNQFKDVIHDTMGKWRSAERIFSAELDKAGRLLADKAKEVAALQGQLESLRKEFEDFKLRIPAWDKMRSMGKVGMSPVLRWERVATQSDEIIRALTGLPSSEFLEAFEAWMDANGAITDTALLSHEKVQELLALASELPPPPVQPSSAANGFAPSHPSVLDHHIDNPGKGQGGVPRLFSNKGETYVMSCAPIFFFYFASHNSPIHTHNTHNRLGFPLFFHPAHGVFLLTCCLLVQH